MIPPVQTNKRSKYPYSIEGLEAPPQNRKVHFHILLLIAKYIILPQVESAWIASEKKTDEMKIFPGERRLLHWVTEL